VANQKSMRAVFNSLGSNYNWQYVWHSLKTFFGSSRSNSSDSQQLSNLLEKKLGGKAFLFYKGRDAIEFLLRSAQIGEGDLVLTQALSCFAIEEAIIRAGASPAYVDTEENALNLSVNTLEQSYQQLKESGDAKKPRAVIVQNLLGVNADITGIKNWCQKHNLILILDLAQSFGISNTLTDLADGLVLSFGRDKIIDAVSGGAAIIKNNTKFPTSAQVFSLQVSARVGFEVMLRDKLYPVTTWMIRSLNGFGLDKLIFAIGQATGVLGSPTASPTKSMTVLPNFHASLALLMLDNLQKQIYHRRKIARYYLENLRDQKNIQLLTTAKDIEEEVPTRFAVLLDKPDILALWLAQRQIFLSDRWYRMPADSGRLQKKSAYSPGSCVNTENIVNSIFNLPTHINCTLLQAANVVEKIKNYELRN
jgi:perosamine synthetase